MNIRFGCQTYTWQMSIDQYKDKTSQIIDVISNAGFNGIELEVCMLGPYTQRPEALSEKLHDRGIALGALCLALEWSFSEETEEEIEEANLVLDYLSHFPDALLILAQLPGKDRRELDKRRHNALRNIHTLSARAEKRGIRCAFHPNSPDGSLFRIEEDYEWLFRHLNHSLCGYVPDSGHIRNGGMDPLKVIKEQFHRIDHVHYKDMDNNGQWAPMGLGSIDHIEITKLLHQSNYGGWIMVEEESSRALDDPDGVTIHNAEYVKHQLANLLN